MKEITPCGETNSLSRGRCFPVFSPPARWGLLDFMLPDRMPEYMSDRMWEYIRPDMSWCGSHEVKSFCWAYPEFLRCCCDDVQTWKRLMWPKCTLRAWAWLAITWHEWQQELTLLPLLSSGRLLPTTALLSVQILANDAAEMSQRLWWEEPHLVSVSCCRRMIWMENVVALISQQENCRKTFHFLAKAGFVWFAGWMSVLDRFGSSQGFWFWKSGASQTQHGFALVRGEIKERGSPRQGLNGWIWLMCSRNSPIWLTVICWTF